MPGIFGNLFDLNGDGKLDAIERGLDFMMFNEIINQENQEDTDNDDDFDLDF